MFYHLFYRFSQTKGCAILALFVFAIIPAVAVAILGIAALLYATDLAGRLTGGILAGVSLFALGGLVYAWITEWSKPGFWQKTRPM